MYTSYFIRERCNFVIFWFQSTTWHLLQNLVKNYFAKSAIVDSMKTFSWFLCCSIDQNAFVHSFTYLINYSLSHFYIWQFPWMLHTFDHFFVYYKMMIASKFMNIYFRQVNDGDNLVNKSDIHWKTHWKCIGKTC